MMRATKKVNNAYFKQARDWHAERLLLAKIHGNRWFLAFLIAASLVLLLTCCIITLLPLKTWLPFVVHQNTTTGEVWIDRPTTRYVPENDAQTQADLVRYVTHRESYTAADLNYRFQLVLLLSNSLVAKQYIAEQANSNPTSPVNRLSDKGSRTIHIEDIVFLDKTGTQELRHFRQPAHNLAKVDFTVTTIDSTGKKTSAAKVATIAWAYLGIPKKQEDAWENWNGFTVTAYRVDQRNLITNSSANNSLGE